MHICVMVSTCCRSRSVGRNAELQAIRAFRANARALPRIQRVGALLAACLVSQMGPHVGQTASHSGGGFWRLYAMILLQDNGGSRVRGRRGGKQYINVFIFGLFPDHKCKCFPNRTEARFASGKRSKLPEMVVSTCFSKSVFLESGQTVRSGNLAFPEPFPDRNIF